MESAGRFLLRIEDIDRARCRAEFETDITDDPRLARPQMGTAGAPPIRPFR